MTSSRIKSDPLSETAKTQIRECYIESVYGRKKELFTTPILKGIMTEPDSFSLVEEVLGKIYFKNKEKLENEFITGTPDIIDVETIIDVKSSLDLWTFTAVDEDYALKTYKQQLIGYCWMTGKKKAEIIFCLNNMPESLLEKELYKMNLQSEEQREVAKKNFIYDDIPANKRLKRYIFDVTEDDFNAIEERVILAREYMEMLVL
jgi:hypothetical protein